MTETAPVRPLITIDKVARTLTIHLDQIESTPAARVSMADAVEWTLVQARESILILKGLPSKLRYRSEGL